MLKILFSLLFCTQVWAESPEPAIQKALSLKLYEDPQWLNLLNFRRDYFWIHQSQADNPAFFLSPQGKRDARAELIADIVAFYDPQFSRKSPDGTLDEKAQCIFPGRALYLERKLDVKFPDGGCTRFINFREILSAKSATYVFSSYYLNNPSSGFGHSFLRLNRAAEALSDKRYELIDFGAGFAAIPTTSNPILYSIMGLAGFFQGRFDINPYYYKVREYNNFESRDLWEYDLNLSQEAVDLLVAHIFELDAAGFDYYYFSENCSYRILAALDAADPSLHLVERMKMAVMPGDTIQVVNDTPGLVRDRKFRPSGRAIFEARLAGLTAREGQKIRSFAQDENVDALVAGSSEIEKKNILDAAMDYIDFKYAEDVLKKQGKYALKKEILIRRSEVNLISENLPVRTPNQEAPDIAHGSGRWNLGYQSKEREEGQRIGLRFSLHDLLDPQAGYPETSELEMMGFEGIHRMRQNDFVLNAFTFANITSISPWSFYNHALSWQFRLGAYREYEQDCDGCLPVILSGSVGYSQEFFSRLLVTEMIQVSSAYSESFYKDHVLLGAGPALRFRYRLNPSWVFLSEFSYRYDGRGATQRNIREASFATQYSFNKTLGLRLSVVSDNKYFVDLNYYY